MTPAILTFTRLLSWAVLIFCALTVMIISAGRASQSELDTLMDRLHGKEWRSRVPYLVGVTVSAAWLYASWGIQ